MAAVIGVGIVRWRGGDRADLGRWTQVCIGSRRWGHRAWSGAADSGGAEGERVGDGEGAGAGGAADVGVDGELPGAVAKPGGLVAGAVGVEGVAVVGCHCLFCWRVSMRRHLFLQATRGLMLRRSSWEAPYCFHRPARRPSSG